MFQIHLVHLPQILSILFFLWFRGLFPVHSAVIPDNVYFPATLRTTASQSEASMNLGTG